MTNTPGRSWASAVFLIDVNILLYAHFSFYPQHRRAREWLDGALNGTSRVAMPWFSLLGFLRIATNPRMLIRPQSVSGAVKQMQDWLANDLVWVPQPGERHAEILGRLLVALNSGGDTVPDTHLAALAIE